MLNIMELHFSCSFYRDKPWYSSSLKQMTVHAPVPVCSYVEQRHKNTFVVNTDNNVFKNSMAGC